MKKHRIAVTLIAIVSMVGLIAGCGGSSNSGKSSTPSSVPSSTSQNPDYSISANWLALPSSKAAKKKVDVFFLYPTVYEQSSPSAPMICAINNPQMQSGAKAAFSRTATAFAPLADIYAPYYQQAAISVLTLPLDQQQAIVGGVPTSDALAAFDYYIKHYNKGRPFILAGHSQGSNIMINLMAEYMKKNPKVYKRMVAAFVPGYSITPQYLAQNPELKFAEGPNDTGVIVSYNTTAPAPQVPDPVVLPGAMVINPITWNRSEVLATAAQNLGGIAVGSNGYAILDAQGNPQKVLNYADAQINTAKGVLICSTANPSQLDPGNKLVAAGIYHNYDYPFYYFDIRANAANRIARYLVKK
jgi:pimeloyl-ACP methyl ester carboxylesterase